MNKRKWFSLNNIICQLYASLTPTAITSPSSSPLVYPSGSCVGFLLILRLGVLWGSQVLCLHSKPSTEYNPGHFLQHQEPLPLEHSLKCPMTFSIFTSSFSSMYTSSWVVVRSPGSPCPLWNMPFSEAAPSLSCHRQCPHTGTAAPQPPSRLQRSQDQSLQASVGWDSPEGRIVLQVRRILSAEERACGNYGACLD